MMTRSEISESLPVGIVMERRRIDHPWKDYTWRTIAVVPGAPPLPRWHLLRRGEGWERYHAGNLTLQLFRKETEGYRHNLMSPQPVVYVILRPNEEEEEEEDEAYELIPFHVTVCPLEAQDYADSGEEVIEPVAMPEILVPWVSDFIDKHPVVSEFKKRKRKPYDPRKAGFGPSRGSGR